MKHHLTTSPSISKHYLVHTSAEATSPTVNKLLTKVVVAMVLALFLWLRDKAFMTQCSCHYLYMHLIIITVLIYK